MASNGDALHAFKQNTDLFWLTGIEQEDSMVILFRIVRIQIQGSAGAGASQRTQGKMEWQAIKIQ